MNIIKMLVNPSKYEIKCPYTMNATRIVVHNTANDASARNEISYMINNNNQTSFHYAIDDKEVVQGIPENRNAWHAGDGGSGTGNRQGLSIEICYSRSGGTRFTNAEKLAAKFIALKLKERGWGINKVTKHQDYSGKYCPHRTLDMGWQRFLNMIQAELNASNSEPSTPTTSNPKVKTGYVEITYGGSDGLVIHSKPSWDDKTVSGVVRKGEVFTIVGGQEVGGVWMYKIKSGKWITSAIEYVKYRSTLHESKPSTPTNSAKDKDGYYKVGIKVCTNTLATSSTGGKVYKGDWKGTITRVIKGTPYPYLLDNGNVGWTNDKGIDTDPHTP